MHGPLVFGVFWPQNTGVLTIIRPGIPEFLPEFLSGFLKEQEYRFLRWRCKCTGQPHGILEKAVGIRVIRPEHRNSHQNSPRNSRILTGIPIGILKRTRIKNSQVGVQMHRPAPRGFSKTGGLEFQSLSYVTLGILKPFL